MIVAIRIEPSRLDGEDEYVRMADMATMGEILAELTATGRHYTKVRDRHHRVTARSYSGKVLAAVRVSPDAVPRRQGVFRLERVGQCVVREDGGQAAWDQPVG